MSDQHRRAWASAATRLAEFAFSHLPNRCDVWGAYVHPAHRATWGRIVTAPAKRRRGLQFLTPATLARHFAAAHPGDVIGLHTTSPALTSRWFGLDFDVHVDDGPLPEGHAETVRAALAWCVEAMTPSCSILLEDSNGAGGRHLWVRFDAPVATPRLYAWLYDLARRCGDATGYRPETYPKQGELPSGKQFGNWLRLPGLHHTRPHWSRLAFPGERWQRGAAAVERFLAWDATSGDVVPADLPEPPSLMMHRSVTHHGLSPSPTGERNRAQRIARYIEKLPLGTAGTGRSNHCYRLACFLMHDMQCTEGEALPVLLAWNSGNAPPLPDAKVRETWQNAAIYGGHRVA